MFISTGWFYLVGGVWGAIASAIAKKFYKSDFANEDGVIPPEDYKTEVRITPTKRRIIVGICGALAVAGLLIIQHDHNWNPFHQ
jgi:uncharacterized membrane protein YeaQ/YmgE (transglycosylase-associated protein family)